MEAGQKQGEETMRPEPGEGVGIGIRGLFLSRLYNTLAVGSMRGEREMARLQLGGLSG